MSKIVWLASYPKSGNTWARIFLNNYMLDGDTPADINKLEEGIHAGTRELFDRLTGIESSDLTTAEIDRVRPWMYQQWAAETRETLFVKVHDAWRHNDQGEPIFPPEVTKTAVYIIRNPLDIVSSFAHHYSLSVAETIDALANSEYALASSTHKLNRQLPQWMGSWHEHVTSWTERANLPVHVMRYEDMCQTPTAAFGGLVKEMELPLASERLAKAIHFSNFEQMKQQETAVGFKERLPGVESFFRQGKFGGWQTELSPAQIEAICHNHGEIMQKYGYLNRDGQPVVYSPLKGQSA